jgi:hypothetical protein
MLTTELGPEALGQLFKIGFCFLPRGLGKHFWQDGVQIHVVAFHGALADGREFHGAEVFQRCHTAAFDFLYQTDDIVSVTEDAVFQAVDLAKERALLVLAYRNWKAGGFDVIEQFRGRNRVGCEPVKVGRDAMAKLERDG